jgi:hypothetical protein
MPGKHITVDRIAKYRSLRKGRSRFDAARIVLISVNSARRVDQGSHFSQRPVLATYPASRRGKRSMMWNDMALEYIASHPGALAKAVFDHLLKQTRDTNRPVSPSHRRSFERWYVHWKLQRGISPKKHPDLAESYTFLRAAHQGFFDPAALKRDKSANQCMPLLVKMAMSSSLHRRNRALFVLGITSGVPLAYISSYLMLADSTIRRWSGRLNTQSPKQFLSAGPRKRPGSSAIHKMSERCSLRFSMLHQQATASPGQTGEP